MKNSHDPDEVDNILVVNPIGHALLPILRGFRGVDPKLYCGISIALFRAYEAGLKGALSDLMEGTKSEPTQHH